MLKRVKLLLKPRTFRYKKIHKNRKILYFKNNISLSCGTAGLLLLQPTRLHSGQINKFKLFLKKAVKKFDKTHRFYWFNAAPHLPLTQKATGSRMGKGKGKIQKWFVRLKGGIFLFEFINLRSGRAEHFIKQISYRLPVPSKSILQSKTFFTFPFLYAKKSLLRIFW